MTDNLTARVAVHSIAHLCWLAAHELAARTGEPAESIYRRMPGSGTGAAIMRKRRTEFADQSEGELLALWRDAVIRALDSLAHELADTEEPGRAAKAKTASKRAGEIMERYLKLAERFIGDGGAKFTIGRTVSIVVLPVDLPTFEPNGDIPA